ncbi:MAG: acetate--CoA ligase family protein, partial [Ignavibacteria bacterium]|nr:acetate--CoA ligase family protein [Ignavibacteria bacterium]
SQLEQSTKEKIKPLLVPEASLNNPIDMLPSADGDVFKQVTEIVLEDSNVDAVIVIYVEPIMTDAFDVISKVSQVQKQSKKPVLVSCFPLPKFWNKWKNEGEADSKIYNSVELPPKILENLLERKKYFEKFNLKLAKEEKQFVISNKKLELIEKLLSKTTDGFLPQELIIKLSKAINLPVAKSKVVKNLSEAKNVIGKFNFPLVLKIESDEITHKSDVGGVITGIQNKTELKRAFEIIESNLKKKKLLDKINGYLVQEQIQGGVEVIVGGFRDENFGPVVMFGAGGKLVELIKDSNFLLAPVNYNQVIELIKRSKVYEILKGYRGEKEYDLSLLSKIIILCSELLCKVK